jgi:hypothetical protein
VGLEVTPSLGDTESFAVRAAFATAGFAFDAPPDPRRSVWSRVAACEAVGYDTDEWPAALPARDAGRGAAWQEAPWASADAAWIS